MVSGVEMIERRLAVTFCPAVADYSQLMHADRRAEPAG
jgi:hypothetical protein